MSDLIDKKSLILFLKEDLNSNHDIFKKLLGHLSVHLDDLLKSKDDLVNQGSLAHKAKTGCSSFGAMTLFYKLEEFESLSKNNNSIAQKKLFSLIEELIDPSLSEIKSIANDYFKGASKSA
jgi:hypothetical protein